MVQTQAYSAADIKRFKSNYKDEVDGAALYRLLAEAEKDDHLRTLYERLAVSEDRHLALWEQKLREAGTEPPRGGPSLKVRMLGWLARRFGTGLVAPIVTNMELAAQTMYDDQPEAVAENLPADERSHARLFREIAKTGKMHDPQVSIAQVEGRHRGASGNALRAAVLGANDGLVSNLALVVGVAGASPGQDIVILAGIGGLVAGALSMAQGEWISVRSSAEAFERQVAIERDELALMPEEEEEELTLIYQAKGLTEADARQTARRILSDHEMALETLTREELGMSRDEAGNPWVAALASLLMFATGAIIPLIPWFFGGGSPAAILSVIFGAIGLFGLGAAITLFTGRSAWYSGSRQMLQGVASAGIAYLIGSAVGATTGI
jgi:VIT1/CCC1 family predicted Fe2+/Mn2+ transporter